MAKTIKYSVCLMKNPSKGTTKAYARVQSEHYTFTELAEQATAETTVTRADCEAVVRAVLSAAIENPSSSVATVTPSGR